MFDNMLGLSFGQLQCAFIWFRLSLWKYKKRSNKLKLYIAHYHKNQESSAVKSGESTNVNVWLFSAHFCKLCMLDYLYNADWGVV